METIKDITTEMREFADIDACTIGRDVLRRRIQHFARRIDEASKTYDKEVVKLLKGVVEGICFHCDMQSTCQEGEDGMPTTCNAVAKARHFIEQHSDLDLDDEYPF